MQIFNMFTLFGIPCKIHLLTLLILAFLFIINPAFSLLLTICLFYVIPHEYGHALAGRYFGKKCDVIIITPLGGLAVFNDCLVNWKPKHELFICLAGPLVNLIIAGIAFLFSFVLFEQALELIYIVNLMLCIFNMIPMLPTDGGRVLRSILAFYFNIYISTLIAFSVSVVIAILLASYAFYSFDLMILFIVALMMIGAKEELELSKETYENSVRRRRNDSTQENDGYVPD